MSLFVNGSSAGGRITITSEEHITLHCTNFENDIIRSRLRLNLEFKALKGVDYFTAVWTEHFLSFEKAGAQTPLQLWGGLKNCWAWANPVKDMMCDISLLSCSHVKRQWRKVTEMQPDKNKDKSHKSHYLQGLVLGPMWKHEVQRGDIYDICTDDDDEVLYFSKKSLNICFVFFNICKLHVLRLKTGLNSPTFKVRNKFCPNLLTYLISLTPTH